MGSAFLGSGGGGSVKAGEMFIQVILSKTQEIRLWMQPLTEEQKATMGCAVADIGANGALDPKQDKALLYAFDMLLKHAAKGENIGALFPLETGPENMLAPFVVAAMHNLPVVDGDGAGRAVPTLSLCTFSQDHYYAKLPIAMANGQGDRLLVNSDNTDTHEPLLRELVQLKSYHNSASLALWPDYVGQLAKRSVPHSVSYALNCGMLFEGLHSGNRQLIDESTPFVNQLKGYFIGRGVLLPSLSSEEDGFSYARIKIKDTKGKIEYTLIAQNESLVCFASDRSAPLAFAPTAICCLGRDGKAYTNAELTDKEFYDTEPEIMIFAVMPREELNRQEFIDGFIEVIKDLLGESSTFETPPVPDNVSPLGDLIISQWNEK